MKLTQKQIQNLNDTLYHLERALDYINKQDTVIGIKVSKGSSDAFRHSNEHFDIRLVNKEYGSNITGLSMGIERLRQFITYNTNN